MLTAPGRPPNQLQRLVVLRWIEVAGQVLVLAMAWGYLHIPLQLAPMVAVTGALAVFNAITWWRQREQRPVGDGEILFQLAVDVAALTVLLYFSGGSTNPFVSLLLLPLTIAAATLPATHAWCMAGLTLVAYSILMFVNIPLPPPESELKRIDDFILGVTGIAPEHAGHGGGFGLHVLGMWLNFLLSALIVAFFVARMAAALRARDRELARAREAALRNEQILSLGTLAAGAAHQLGTPLSTMAVVLRELELQHGGNLELAADLVVLRQQVESCKTILSQLLAAAGQSRGEGGAARALDDYLRGIIEEWRVIKPGVMVTSRLEAPRPAPRILTDRTLEQAIINLLDNAADASPAGIEVRAIWDAGECIVEILDRGPGLDQIAAGRIGQPFFTTKADKGGLGIGIFLSNATLERFGGKVELFNREGGGACTRIRLPLAKLLVE